MTIAEPTAPLARDELFVTTSNNKILSVNFNQDFSCISVGTESGYRIYTCDPFGKSYSKRKQLKKKKTRF
jgi:hypothetical protein